MHIAMLVYATAKPFQLCPTLCDPIDGSLPGSPVPGIFQARVLEWGTIAPSVRVINQDIAYSYTKTSGTPRLKRVGNSDIQWLAGAYPMGGAH